MTTFLLILALVGGVYMSWSIGANDVANAMGTSVGSRALTLRRAVVIAAVLEFAGALLLGRYVTETVQSGIVDVSWFTSNPEEFAVGMIAALFSAAVWLQFASYFGWPVSTTHTIVGSIVGFGLLATGWRGILWKNVGIIVTSWVLSPFLGGFLSFLLFYFLREKIFCSKNPLRAAKRWTPLLFLFVALTCTFLFSLTAFGKSTLFRSTWIPWAWGSGIGVVGAVITWFLVHRIDLRQAPSVTSSAPAAIARGLEKATKNLMRAQDATEGDMHYRLGVLLGEVESMKKQIGDIDALPSSHSSYAAVEGIFRYMQILTAMMMAFAHGANDVANAIGPVSAAWSTLRLGHLPIHGVINPWILALGGVGIVFGLATWGWRVIETIGKKITELTPTRGFAAEFGAATTIVLASRLGLPISTTHTLVGAVIGVGFARGISALNLRVIREIVTSWVVTVPVGAILSMIFFLILRALLPFF